MNVLIEVVRVANFRALKNIELRLSTITLLVGMNNSGKTSLMRSLCIALGSLGKKHISKEDFHIGSNSTSSEPIIIDVKIIPEQGNKEFDYLWFDECINAEAEPQTLAFRTKVYFNSVLNDYVIEKFIIESWQEEKEGWECIRYEKNLKTELLKALNIYLIDAQRDIILDLKNSYSYAGKLLSQIKVDQTKIGEIESKINDLNCEIVENSEELSHLKDELALLSNTLDTHETIEITPLNKKIRDLYKGLNINIQNADGESFPLDYHGMGTRSWAALLAFKAFNAWMVKNISSDKRFYSLLALEEPEAHLHPNAQRVLFTQMNSIKGQKIISTHSPYLAALADLKDIRHFIKSGSGVVITSLDSKTFSEEDLGKLRREILKTRGELFFSRAIIFVEGETEEIALPIYFKKYFGKSPFELGINFVSVNGQANYAPFIQFADSFSIKWYIFGDGEKKAQEELKKALGKTNSSLGIADPNIFIIPSEDDYEEYLIKSGYQQEIKKALIEFKKSKGEQISIQYESVILTWDDSALRQELDSKRNNYLKIALAARVAELIVAEKNLPDLVKELFDKIKLDLNIIDGS
ncbi:MAG: ATP-dependent nuclease [Vampirovibrionia bacterium]